MLTIILWFFATLYLLKILWNLTVPYTLAARALKPDCDWTSGISLMPAIEIVLVVLVYGLSFAVPGALWLQDPWEVLACGFALIVFSYVHMVVAGFLLGWWVSRRRRGTLHEVVVADGSWSGGEEPPRVMATEVIRRIWIDDKGRLCILPNTETFEHIYRAACEVHWDDALGCLYSPKPREWSYLDWYNHILGAVESEYNCRLIVDSRTEWVDVPEEIKAAIASICRG